MRNCWSAFELEGWSQLLSVMEVDSVTLELRDEGQNFIDKVECFSCFKTQNKNIEKVFYFQDLSKEQQQSIRSGSK